MSLEDLLKEFGDEPTVYTREQFDTDRARVCALLCAKHGIEESEIEELIREHRYTHSAEDPEEDYMNVMTRGRHAGWVVDNVVVDKSTFARFTDEDRALAQLTSCDFVGDSGCTDPTCWQCFSPIGPRNLEYLAKNLKTAGMLSRAWQLRGENPAWEPGCKLGKAV